MSDSPIYSLPNVTSGNIGNDTNTRFPLDVSTDGGTTWNTYYVTMAQLSLIMNSFFTAPSKTQRDTCTTGTPPAVTISNGVTELYIDPASLIANYTINPPAAPVIGQQIKVYFGGTIAGGSAAITSLTFADTFGFLGVPPTSAKSGDCTTIEYVNYNGNNYWRIVSIYKQ